MHKICLENMQPFNTNKNDIPKVMVFYSFSKYCLCDFTHLYNYPSFQYSKQCAKPAFRIVISHHVAFHLIIFMAFKR